MASSLTRGVSNTACAKAASEGLGLAYPGSEKIPKPRELDDMLA
jgi:hypothetical protein